MQLHATIPAPNGAHACLALYDVCPHTTYSTASRYRHPYLHCDLPSPRSTSNPHSIEYINKDGTRIVETTHSTLSPDPGAHRIHAIHHIDRKARKAYDSTYDAISTIQHPKEKAMAASLAKLVLSKHSPMMHHVRSPASEPPPLRSILKSTRPLETMPTIYLLSFSTDRAPTTKHFARLLNDHLPSGVPLRYTIDARRFLVPSRQIQDNYSGVAEITQDAVLRDRGARREIEHAVHELMGFVQDSSCIGGGRETAIAVCCTAGTHRSVAIAECVARGVRQRVRRAGEGVQCKVVVRHVHRIKGIKDPF
ncbi:uncharacterized protein M421DRAFT_3439 [Didymella exigua CBS 183.55]|uniref:RapZ C-terminal domain-containing protein n=1 Tax=Didymella exigua CBS 183.55 TaxID=1150837 RepID=A0A6A5RT93_9PLEO|nr:uncharacterized protein M421DRAFT_3439 [Didymella exigua CBS 183.55]KAF1930364.1 hypothetical protein M421DRAFT_3439 [Didymella exigua CBS 183.55]